jgi:hypothetical protein
MFSYLDARLPGNQGHSKGLTAVYVVLSVVGLLMVIAPGSAIFGGGAELCDCESPMRANLSLVVVSFATLTFWIASILKRPLSWLLNASAVLGYLGTIGIVVFGLIRAISDAVDIIG